MKKTFFNVFTVILLLGLTALGYSEMRVSLNTVNVDLPKIEVDIQLTDGEDVAGYYLLLAYDPTVLKYVDTTQGDYLPPDGIFLRPALGADDTYELQLSIDDEITTGQSVVFELGEEAQTLSLSDVFFEVPDPSLFSILPDLDVDVDPADLKFQALGISSLAPFASDGNGTLASVSFDVLNPDAPMVIYLIQVGLFDADDEELYARIVNNVATFKRITSDVNADGDVNILDLTRVAAVFGEVITAANRVADVNVDGVINILDLVQVANNFGQSVLSVVYTTELPVDTVVETDIGSVGQINSSEPGVPADLTSPAADIVVGLVLPLSGHLTEIGEIMKTGFDLAFGELKGTIGIKYIIADDKSTAEGAVATFEELIYKQGVSVILGPGSSSSAEAAFPVAQDNEVVAISATAGASGLAAIGDFVFRVPLATDIIIPQAVEITKRKMGYQKVATLYDETDLFSTDRDAALQQALLNNAVEVLGTQTYTTGTTDFTTQLRRIKALNPDAIFVSALPPEKPAILIQARKLDITAPILISSLTQVEVEAAGAAAEGALTFTGWISTDETPRNRAFVEKYKSIYGTTPNAFAALSYACVYVLAEALKNAAATDAHSIRDALANIGELDTILGKFSFNADGDGVYIPNILIVEDGRLQFFD